MDLYISDLHLDPEAPERTAAFLEFCHGPARAAARLVIVGDLFEAWVGDDDDGELPAAVAAALGELAAAGVELGFVHGNRDFMLGADYAARCGMRLLPEYSSIRLAGRSALLLHGDQLCTDDHAYQAVRAQVRDPVWQAQMRLRPLSERRALAAAARQASRQHTSMAAAAIMDVNAAAVRATLTAAGVRILLHGHTHRPAVHHVRDEGGPWLRIVLGDWGPQPSYLRVDGEHAELHAGGRVTPIDPGQWPSA